MTHNSYFQNFFVALCAQHYFTRIGTTYGAQTKVTPAEAAAQYQLLKAALTGRSTDHATKKEGSAAVDAEELRACTGLHRAYASLLHQHFEQPERAYTYFPCPQTTGAPADANLPSLPQPE